MNRFCALLMTLVLAVPSMAQSSTAVRNRENRKAQLEKEIEEIDRLLRDNAKESASASTRLALTQKKIANRRELLSQCDTKIASLNGSIRGKDRQIAVLQNRLNILTEHYGRLVLGAYKSRDSRHWYMFILTSENLAQAYRRYSFLRGLSSEMNTQAIQIHSLQDSLELEKSRLRSLKHEQESLRGERQKEIPAGIVCQAKAGSLAQERNRKTYRGVLEKRQDRKERHYFKGCRFLHRLCTCCRIRGQ